MKKLWREFKEFAVKGNAMDLAIGVIIGGAFGKIVSSLVNDILMPLLGLLLGGIDFTSLQVDFGETAIKYGAFIQSIIDFLIISLTIFIITKTINRVKEEHLHREAEATPAPPAISNEEKLLMEIRDLLKEKA